MLSQQLILLLTKLLLPLTLLAIILNDTICVTDGLIYKENTSNSLTQSSDLLVLATSGTAAPIVYFGRSQPRNPLLISSPSDYSYSLVLLTDLNSPNTNWTIYLNQDEEIPPQKVYIWPKTSHASIIKLSTSQQLPTTVEKLSDTVFGSSVSAIPNNFALYPTSFWSELKNLTNLDYTVFAYSDSKTANFEFKNPLLSGCGHGGSTSFDKFLLIALIAIIVLWICFILAELVVISIPIIAFIVYLLISGKGKKISNYVSKKFKILIGKDKSLANKRIIPEEQMKNEIEHSKPSSVSPRDMIFHAKDQNPLATKNGEIELEQQHSRFSSLGPADLVFQASKNTPTTALTIKKNKSNPNPLSSNQNEEND